MMMPDDAALLRRYAAEKAEEAFAALVRRHVDAVYSTALRRLGGDVQLAQDVVQQVFVALARNAATLARHPALGAWLYLTTRNEAANVVRRERRWKAREQEAQAMHENETDEPVADWGRLAPMLDGAIDGLATADRTAIVLRFVDRRNYAEIGRALRVSEDAARMRVERALAKLRDRLSRVGVSSTSAALSLALTNHAVIAAPAQLAETVVAAAISSAPVGTTALTAIFQIMNTTKAVASAVGLVAVLAVGTAVKESFVRHDAESALASAVMENRALEDQLRLAERRVVATREASVQLERTIQANATARGNEAKAKAPTAYGMSPTSLAAGREFLGRHPELRQLVIAYARQGIDARFSGLYRKLGLTPEQIELFADWMMLDSGVIRQIPGVNGELMALTVPGSGDQELRRAKEREMAQALGRDAIDGFKQWFQQYPARQLATNLSSNLFYSSTPLTSEQTEQIIAVASGSMNLNRGWNGSYDWATLRPKVESVLSSSQLAALDAIQAQQTYDQALRAALRGANATTAQNGGGR